MRAKQNKTAQDYAEIIRAITPIILASMGGFIGVFALHLPELDNTKVTAAMGLASTAIAGASGLAQSTKNETNFKSKEDDETNSKPEEYNDGNSNI